MAVVSYLVNQYAPFTIFSILVLLVLMIVTACCFLSAILGCMNWSRHLGYDLSQLYHPQIAVNESGISYGAEGYISKSGRGRVYKQSFIAFSNIECVIHYQEDNMIEFFGQGDDIVYLDHRKTRLVSPREGRRFGEQYKMRFFLCLTDNQAFLGLLNQYDFEVYER